jgi:DNA-binding response OmpR family regulator
MSTYCPRLARNDRLAFMSVPSSTVLLVEDDPDNRQLMSIILRGAGLHVVEAGTGAEALRLARDRPDLVILDVNLPDVSGFEICRCLRADPATRSVPVLQVSGVFVHSDDRSQGLEEGADAYLVKPVEPRELLATVRSLLRVHAAEEAARASAQQWRTTFDAIGDAVFLLDGTASGCYWPRTARRPSTSSPGSAGGSTWSCWT